LTSGGRTSNRRVIHLDLKLLPDKSSQKYNPFKAKRMLQYIPGDAIGVVVPNKTSLVNWLLHRLQLRTKKNEEFVFQTEGKGTPTPARDIAMGSLPRRRSMEAANVPKKYRTPRLTLTHVLDLSTPPRRGMLRALADYCVPHHSSACTFTDEQCEIEKCKLLLLSSKDGRDEYEKIITKLNSGLPEILHMFPTCLPPLSLLVGGLKTLMPRYYSVSSSPLRDPTQLSITFTIVEFNTKPPPNQNHLLHDIGGDSNKDQELINSVKRSLGTQNNHPPQRPIQRQGLCTSWLEEVAMPMLLQNEQSKNAKRNTRLSTRSRGSSKSSAKSQSNSESEKEGETKRDLSLCPSSSPSKTCAPTKIPIYIRETKEFALPANHKYPIIMVGPGTGVAPFIGFLEHRQKQLIEQSDHKDDVCSGYWRMGFEVDDLEDDEEYSNQNVNSNYGECVLFFGNRNRSKDFLYENKLNEFLKDGTLNQLHVAFSRDGPKKIYVQDKMREQSANIYRMLMKENGHLFVCGDGAKMAKDVEKVLIEIFRKEGKMKDKETAMESLELLKKKSRYVKDVWS
jgi:sulfite reductase alpha subunit-like flavoprotein